VREVLHVFDTTTEANAFVVGVEWVNDSAIEVIDILVGDDELGPRSAVLCHDEDGEFDVEFDHREDRERVERVKEAPDRGRPCACTTTSGSDGALCLCHERTLRPSGQCRECEDGLHLFEGIRSVS
jgi:hypothetical protein